MFNRFHVLLFLACGLLGATAAQAAIVIDNYTDTVVVLAPGTTIAQGLLGIFVPRGGERAILLADPAGGTLEINLGGSGQLVWDPAGATSVVLTNTPDRHSPGLPRGIDLTEGARSGLFEVEIVDVTGTFDIDIGVRDSDSTDTEIACTGCTAGIVTLDFNRFFGIDFDAVNGVSLELSSSGSSACTLSEVEAGVRPGPVRPPPSPGGSASRTLVDLDRGSPATPPDVTSSDTKGTIQE